MSEAAKQSIVSGNQVLSAGLASAGAALVTSKFGVAGTLLGAALTAMLVTGGSAVLKSYLESLTGNVRKMPRKMRARRERWRAGRGEAPPTIANRPDLRDNFVGRMRAAFAWFSHLPTPSRRSIMLKGLVAAVLALAVGLGTIFVAEKAIGNNLSCGLWAECAAGAEPGIHPLGLSGTGARSTISSLGGGSSAETVTPQQDGSSGGLFQGQEQPAQETPSGSGVQPADPNEVPEPAPDTGTPAPQPAPEEGVPADGPVQEVPSGTPSGTPPSGTPGEVPPPE